MVDSPMTPPGRFFFNEGRPRRFFMGDDPSMSVSSCVDAIFVSFAAASTASRFVFLFRAGLVLQVQLQSSCPGVSSSVCLPSVLDLPEARLALNYTS